MSALLLGLLSYGGLCLLVWGMQNQMIFFPDRRVVQKPSMPYQDLFVTTADGVVLHGWAVPPPHSETVWVLHCHGNGGNISHRLDTIKLLHGLGWGVVVFDYRGYGLSHGQLSRESDLIADGQAFLDEIKTTIKPSKLLLYGESLGGGVVCALALKQPCDGLVLQSTFTSLVDRAQEAYPFLPVARLSRYTLDNRKALAGLTCPKLIMHSARDEVTGIHHGRALYQAAAEPRRWAELRGGHNDPERASLEEPLRQFLHDFF